jgi:disease resistance protein RPM1
VGFSGIGTLQCIDSISSPPPLLRTLRLNGSLEEMPNWIEQLTHLMKFNLWRSKLKEGKTMLVLAALPNLMVLYLHSNAYHGEKLVFKMGAFPNLRTFSIYNLEQLREIRFEDGSSILLEKIEIFRGWNQGLLVSFTFQGSRRFHLDTKVKWLGLLSWREKCAHTQITPCCE